MIAIRVGETLHPFVQILYKQIFCVSSIPGTNMSSFALTVKKEVVTYVCVHLRSFIYESG